MGPAYLVDDSLVDFYGRGLSIILDNEHDQNKMILKDIACK
jgi:hypothetical protein